MQTPAEKHLIEKVVELLKEGHQGLGLPKILNVGAGKSIVLEKKIQEGYGKQCIFDRLDVTDCSVNDPIAGKCVTASVESMPEIKSEEVQIVFANYVFEHVGDLRKASSEVARVLAPSGYFIVSLPNPTAPEFILSKYTSTSFHQMIKGGGEGHHAHETQYAYRSIEEFIEIFGKYFSVLEINYWSNTCGYLYRFPVINIMSHLYDRIINVFNIKSLMGNVCIVFKK